jgi:putative effector of murein hydrolase
MRRKNWRLVIAGCFFIATALGFYFVMQSIAPNSTDPVMAMQITGRVVGVATGVSIVMILVGLIGKKV